MVIGLGSKLNLPIPQVMNVFTRYHVINSFRSKLVYVVAGIPLLGRYSNGGVIFRKPNNILTRTL